MKKFLVIAVVLATVCLSTVAFALDVTVNGEAAVRSRWFQNFGLNSGNSGAQQPNTNDAYTQTRYLLDVNVKGDGVKGKLSIWNDFSNWGRGTAVDTQGGYNTNALAYDSPAIREGWIDFTIPNMPVSVKAGRMLFQLGNGWFVRSNYGGVDAWVVTIPIDKNAIVLMDAKLNEGTTSIATDDIDLYSGVGIFKVGDMTVIGALSYLNDRAGVALANARPAANSQANLMNLGIYVNGKVGPADLKVELDGQNGSSDAVGGRVQYDGYQGVVQVAVPVGAVTVNATAAYGSGDNSTAIRGGASSTNPTGDGYVNSLDRSQHYTLIYEYRIAGANGNLFCGFANTTALEAGLMAKVSKSVEVGADFWWLQATQPINVSPAGGTNGGSASHDLGYEIDAKVNWTIYPNLTWNWQIGYFQPGNAYQTAAGLADVAYGTQGVLSLKF